MTSERKIGWITQTLRQAAWAPLLVLVFVVFADRMFDVFARFPRFDVPAHFFGGLAATYFYWCAAAHARPRAGGLPGPGLASLAFACSAGTAVVWEILEFLSDRLLLTDFQHGPADTLSDLVFGFAGSAAYLLLRSALAPAPGAQAASDPPDESA